jgi:hypothetical protein
MAAPENTPAEVEGQYHRYRGSKIPWYVHLIWLTFWLIAISYTLAWLLPKMRTELLSPP